MMRKTPASFAPAALLVRDKRMLFGAFAVAALALIPIASLLVLAGANTSDIWQHLAFNVLPSSLSITLLLMAGVGLGTASLGIGAAWLVSRYEFRGRAMLHWILVLPLAIPTYISAYCFVEILDFTGPVQTTLRLIFGFSSRSQYWFPDIRSLGGAIFVMSAVLYPYVYLTCRMLFEMQGRSMIEAGRVLGAKGSGLFLKIALPMARPAIVAGIALALMETLNDIGAVEILGVRTLTFSIFDTWLNRSSLAGAAQIACMLLLFAALLLFAERRARGARGYSVPLSGSMPHSRIRLHGAKSAGVAALCLLPPFFGFVMPIATLARFAFSRSELLGDPQLLAAAANSLLVASLTALVTTFAALLLLTALRRRNLPGAQLIVRLATLGYAVPGSVLAIGLLYALTRFDNGLDALSRSWLGYSTGLYLSGSAFIIIYACSVRFLQIAHGAVEAGYTRLSGHVSMVSRTLGRTAWETFVFVELPLLHRALATAALLVFVDTVKELSATILLRPFNFPTLATHVYALASRALFEEAAIAALVIVFIGAIPVLVLNRLQAGTTSSGNRA